MWHGDQKWNIPNNTRIHVHLIVCLLLFYVLAISKVLSERILTCDSVHSWWLYSAAPLRPGSHHHDLISHSVTLSWHWANLSLPNPSWLGRDKYFYVIGLIPPGIEPMRFGSLYLPKQETDTLLIRPSRLVMFIWRFTCCAYVRVE